MSSFIDHRGDGSNKSFLIPFEYYENDQLFAYVDDRLVEIEQYNNNSIVLKDIPPSGSLVRIRRIVDVDTPFATYVTGSDLTEDTLNKNNLKLLYGIQQLNDGFIDDDFYFKQDISMGNNRIIDVADGVDDTDAVNYSQVKNLDANVKQIEQNIIRLEQQAKASKDAAGVSETNAKTSEINAKTSEINSKTSETNAKESELLAKQYEDAAKISETNAKDSELLTKQYADAAKISETNAKTSEINSKTSETNAKESELLAKASKDAAGVSENNAKQYADAAKVSETNAKVSETNTKTSETNVIQIEQNIIILEQQTKASKDAAKTSETNAKTSETNAKDSELLAKQYADAAGVSENNAKQYADAAKVSETNAKTSETNAKTSETNAKTSETNAKVSETNAKESELLAKKYADESKSTKPDYKTIFIDTAGNIATKDIAINEDENDLASKRGQIGKAVLLTNAYSGITDLNTVLKSGIYWITNDIAATLQNCPTSGIGGFLIVSGNEVDTTQQTYHVYNSSNIYTRYIVSGTANTWNKVIIDTDSATTSKKGIVQLSSAVNSNSETIAATSKAVKLAYDKASEAIIKSNLPLGHIYLWPFPTPPDGSIQLNGSEYNRELYSDLWNLVKAKGWYKPESEWQSIASANNGYCPWYSDGDGSTTFRTPKFAPYQKLTLASGDAGKYYEAGLPNVEGGIDGLVTTSSVITNKSFSAIDHGYHDLNASGTGDTEYRRELLFDASRSNSIYGNSTTVQPESNDWIVCVVAFGTATNVGSVDVANVMSAIDQVQANPNLQGTAHLVETWKSDDGTSWYRKYSDGFIEQGQSSVTITKEQMTITFNQPFTSSTYQLITDVTDLSSTNYGEGVSIQTKSTTGFICHGHHSSATSSVTANWYACGY